jgi:hypothetical protein
VAERKRMLDELLKTLTEYFDSRDILWGITDTNSLPFSNEFSRVLVYGVSHSEFIHTKQYKESRFEEIINECKEEIDTIENHLMIIFAKYGIDYFIPPESARK